MSKNSDSVGKKGLFFGLSAAALAAASAMPSTAAAQDAAAPGATEAESEEIVVTGFRRSLAVSLDVKRNSTNIVDAITAEDIADFPDLNLAESIQRIPGVSIDRDAGEGRTITVRGLGSDFTRTRINGMEAVATTGGTDSSGGANRTRAFDYNVFASELFNSIKVNKSAAAATEEGSLGATVDLTTARPFDYNEFTMAMSGQAGYNDISEQYDPRVAFLVADQWLDGRLGALFSVAYANRSLLEEGFSSVRWEAASASGGFQGAPTVIDGRPVAEVFHPRLPRYGRLTHEQDRLGATLALQFRPTDSTDISLDVLYAKLDSTRQEDFLESLSFSRTAAQGGKPQIDIISAEVDDDGDLVFGEFNDVDVRAEQRFDELSTEFRQATLLVEQDLGDKLHVRALLGRAESIFRNPIQTTITFDRQDTDGYTWDFRGNDRLPLIDYGFDVTSASNWSWLPVGSAQPRSEIRLRPNGVDNTFDNAQLDVEFNLTDNFKISGGVNRKDFNFESFEFRRADETLVPVLPTGVTIGDIGMLLTGFGNGIDLPAGTPTSWFVPNLPAVARQFDIYCNCQLLDAGGVAVPGGDFRLASITNGNARGNNRAIQEEDQGSYLQLDFEAPLGPMELRGNLGVRYVETQITASGFLATGGGTPITVEHAYEDTLPAINLALDVTDDLVVRFGGAKVMARPQLANLNPGGTVNTTGNLSITAGNPFLDPFRATTYDLSVEWYFAEESLLSFAYFYKDIESFIQTTRRDVPYNQTGFPMELLPEGFTGEELFAVQVPINTKGGPLEGFEISYQQPFTFLPGPLGNFGGILNYTHVESDIEYRISASALEAPCVFDGAGRTCVRDKLINLSPDAYNATLYYEDERLSARVSAAYRDDYLQRVPGQNGNDVEGKLETLNVDTSATLIINERLSFTFEGLNLTDEFNDQFVDSIRNSSSVYHHTGRQFYLGFRYRY